MKKLMTFLVLLSLMTIPAGCQKAGDSDTSDTNPDDGNAVAANNEGFGGGANASGGCCSGSMAGCCSGCGSGACGTCCSTPMADGCCSATTPGCCAVTDTGCCATMPPCDGCSVPADDGASATMGCTGLPCDGCGAAAGACAGCNDPALAGGCCGAGADGAGGGGPPQFEKGTAEDAIVQIVLAISKGEQTGLAEYISSRANGTLAELRSGKLDKKSLDKLKQQMGRVKILNNRTSGTTKTITLQNVEGETFRFTCRKEDGKYLIREFEIREASGKQKRGRRY